MDLEFKRNSIAILNIHKGTERNNIKSTFSQFGDIVKFKVIPMKSQTKLMAFCRYTNALSMINAIKQSKSIKLNGTYPIIRKAFQELDLENLQQIKITINNRITRKSQDAAKGSTHKDLCICESCMQLNIKKIKTRVNQLENSIKKLNNENASDEEYRLLLRLIELKEIFRTYLNFFTHEKLTKIYQ